jgi:cbb3-type cytochrome oxidase subunit 3
MIDWPTIGTALLRALLAIPLAALWILFVFRVSNLERWLKGLTPLVVLVLVVTPVAVGLLIDWLTTALAFALVLVFFGLLYWVYSSPAREARRANQRLSAPEQSDCSRRRRRSD